MYPYELFFGITLYEVMIAVGFLAAILLLRRHTVRVGISARLYNLTLASVTAAAVGGYLSGYLFQAVYNWLDGKPFTLGEGTGSTFLGGLTGGLCLFAVLYFGLGRFLFGKGGEPIERLPDVMDGSAVGLTCGHAFGRIGCLMAGCCYGIPSDLGFHFPALGYRALPTQLYESLFLFALSAALSAIVKRRRGVGFGVYFAAYGVFRFFLEYLRGDERGSTVVSFLTPSQLVSLLLVLAGILLLYFGPGREARRDKA